MAKLLVISSDAQVGEDLDYLSTLPMYKKYLAKGSVIKEVKSIYPSVTFPCHASMITGNYPAKHQVTSNSQFPVFKDPVPWTWNSEFIKCDDIFKYCKANGLTTASILWPVTAFNKNIDYHIADFWAQEEDKSELDAFVRAGANEEALKIIEKNSHLCEGNWRTHPQRDEFGIACASDIIRSFKPDVLFVHPANIDAARHEGGVFGPHINKALDTLDRWIGELGKALEDANILEETNIFLVSDHGQLDVRRNIGLNVLFKEKGLITLDNKGAISSYRAYCLSNGMSALIYVKDSQDIPLVREYLEELLAEGVYGFSKIYTQSEALQEEKLGGEFAFVLETDGYTAFGDYYNRPLVRPLDNSDYRFGRATHGFLPSKGPKPMIVANGPSIKKGLKLSGASIVDEAPTYAEILGFELPSCDGRVLKEILI